MASVTFPSALGGNGLTYNDNRYDPLNNTEGLDNGGHVLNFVPMLSQTVQMASSASNSAVSAANSLDLFDDRFLGAKASDPITDNDGQPLVIGALYFRTTTPQEVRVYTSTGWRGIGSYTTGTLDVTSYVKSAYEIKSQTTFKDPPNANLLLSNFGGGQAYRNFLVDTSVSTQFNFAYVPVVMGSFESTEFSIDLILKTSMQPIFPSTVRWSGGGTSPNWNKPSFNMNTRSILKFYTSDSGNSWLGSAVVLNASLDNAPLFS